MKKRTFLHDAADFVAIGSHALEKDNFTLNFVPPRLMDDYGTPRRWLSILFRYCLLVPFKLTVFVILFSLISLLFIVSNYFKCHCISNSMFFLYMKLFSFVLGIRTKHIGEKQRIDEPHIYVSNHTSLIDFIILSSHKFHHAVISENHGGMFGFIFRFIISKNGSICFNRSNKKDKQTVKTKIHEHIKKGRALMLIFPEGTCVTNKSTVLFQKGAFDLDVGIVPVGIKYKKILADPYWNRRKHGFVGHLIYLLSRWRIDAEVHWLPMTKLSKGETSTNFSHRVKKLISDKAGLINTPWNGYFKSQLIHADLDMFKLAVVFVYGSIKEGAFGTKEGHFGIKEVVTGLRKNRGEKKFPLSEYKWVRTDSCKIFFDLVTYEEFYFECCKEYLKIKSMSLRERELLINKVDISLGNTPKQPNVIACKCNKTR